MVLKPSSREELCRELAGISARGEKVRQVDLRGMARVVEHAPEDMVVIVEAGLTLGELERQLASSNQWLPLDPFGADHLTVGELLATNASGPRRFGYGTARDYLLGIQVALADGRLIKAGGRVVKNVAGYDLCKLFIGSRGTLGVIVEATFKLLPRPAAECALALECATLTDANEKLARVMESPLTPVVIDLHRLDASHHEQSTLVLSFAGTNEEVEWLTRTAEALGFQSATSVNYDHQFWQQESPAHTISVLPSRLTETLRSLGPVQFVARAGNGLIHYRGGPPPKRDDLPRDLMKRVKATYDPKGVFPELAL